VRLRCWGGVPLPVEIDGGPDESGADGVDDVDAGAIRRAVAHDVTRAEDRGEPVSPGLARWARDLLTPQVPWRSLLRSALGRSVREITSRTDPDWSCPDRRADTRPDFPRPGARHHRPDIAVVLDTSASMSQLLLNAAATEVSSLLHRSGIRELTVLVCDTAAVRPQRVRRLGDLQLKGGGGTDMRVGISAAAATRPTPSMIVVLTDGWTPLRGPR
jgi:predicted metal-dependent peptidase